MSNNTNLRFSLEEDIRTLTALLAVIYAFEIAPNIVAVLASVSVIYWYTLTSRMFSSKIDSMVRKLDQYVSSKVTSVDVKTIRPMVYLSIVFTLSLLALV